MRNGGADLGGWGALQHKGRVATELTYEQSQMEAPGFIVMADFNLDFLYWGDSGLGDMGGNQTFSISGLLGVRKIKSWRGSADLRSSPFPETHFVSLSFFFSFFPLCS